MVAAAPAPTCGGRLTQGAPQRRSGLVRRGSEMVRENTTDPSGQPYIGRVRWSVVAQTPSTTPPDAPHLDPGEDR